MEIVLIDTKNPKVRIEILMTGTKHEACHQKICYWNLPRNPWNPGLMTQFANFAVKGMVVESEVLKAQNCALSKLSLPVHSNEFF